MSSGYNGIPIPTVGRTREKLADMLNTALGLTGLDGIDAEDIRRTNPYHRKWEDSCAWDCHTNERVRRHVYSWATMTHCVKHGIIVTDKDAHDIEV